MQTCIKYHLLLILLYLALQGSHAQNFTTYTISDGLVYNHALSIFQDSKGFLWIGTWNGISKFDGQEFTNFTHNPDDSTSIFEDAIINITEDGQGDIWTLSRQGIMKYESSTNKFKRLYLRECHRQDFDSWYKNRVVFDATGKGWFVDWIGLISFDSELKNIRYIDIADLHKNSTDWNTAMIPDAHGIWLACNEGLLHFSYETLQINNTLLVAQADSVYNYQNRKGPFKGVVSMKSSTGSILVETNLKELYITDTNSGSLLQIDFPQAAKPGIDYKNVEMQCEIAPGLVAFNSNNHGILIYNLITKQFEFGNPLQDYLKDRTTYGIYADSQHNIWVGGLEGLTKYAEPQLNFDSWLYNPNGPKTLSGNSIMSIALLQGDMWLGSSGGGLDRTSLSGHEIKNVPLPKKFSKSSTGKSCYFIHPIDKDRLLVNFDSVLFFYNISQNQFVETARFKYHMYGFYRKDKDHLIISDNVNIFLLEIHERSVEILKKAYLGYHSRDMQKTRTGALFLACKTGLLLFDEEGFKVKKKFIPPGSESDPEVFCIHESKDGILWLGTIRNGIYAFDPKSEKFLKHYNTEDGLIDNSVNVIYGDDSGSLWLNTWKGIARFSPETEQFENYSTVNGLPFTEFNTHAYNIGQQGHYYFGGIGGVIGFHPDSLVNFRNSNPLLITGIQSGVEPISLNYPLKNGDLVNLENDQHSFEISFSCLDFRAADERIFRYKLNGLQKDWTLHKSNDLTARYTNLAPGLYVFELQSTYKNWPWIREGTKLMLQIAAPPLFQRRSFQTVLLIAFALSLLLIIFLRIRNVSIRKEMMIARLEKESNLSRLNYLKSQMNPHFYFNTLNAINNFVLRNDARSANRYLTKFARLMREILENSQKEFVTIDEELRILENYLTLQQLRFSDSFKFTITAEDQVKDKSIPPMLIQPFVENAIEYAFVDMQVKGVVNVKFEMREKNIVCTISDNGIGIEKSQVLRAGRKRKSAAIKNIRQRIEMLNSVYDFTIELDITECDRENENFPGTMVELIFPLIISG